MWIPGKPRDGAWYGVCFGKSAPAAPAAPNPVTVANAQTASNVQTAQTQGQLNRINQYTPYGSEVYSPVPGDTTGNAYQDTVTYSPQEQQAVDSQMALTNSLYGLANSTEGNVAKTMGTPFNPTTAGVPALPTNPSGIDQNAESTVYNAQMAELNPTFQQQQQQLKDEMAQQGIEPGSAAYEAQQTNLGNTQDTAQQQAAATGVTAGTALGAQQFSQELAANQTGLQEAENLYNMPLNEAVAMMSGSPIQGPSFGSTPQTAVSPTDVMGAYGLTQNALNTGYQGALTSANSSNSAEAGLAGAAMTAAAVF